MLWLVVKFPSLTASNLYVAQTKFFPTLTRRLGLAKVSGSCVYDALFGLDPLCSRA